MGDEAASAWEARSRGFDLLGRLVDRGPAPIRAELRAAGLVGFPEDPDAADADHQRWLAREVLPWESVFLTADRLLGGERAERVAAYARGLPLPPAEPDHLGRELAIAGWLCGAIGDALADRRPAEAERVSAQLAGFLRDHLGAWVDLPAIALAGVPGWGPALAMAAELVSDLGIAPVLPPPPARDPLDARAGLRDVADWLATPLATGVAWTHRALERVGAEARIPIGFGSRTDQLESLLRNAADHGRVGDAAAALDAEAARWGGGPWAERTHAARGVIRRLGEAPAPPARP